MSCWVKCTRASGGAPVYVNLEQVRTIAHDGPALSTIKFNHGAEVEIEELPEQLIGEFRDATSGFTMGIGGPNGIAEDRRYLKRHAVATVAGRRLPT